MASSQRSALARQVGVRPPGARRRRSRRLGAVAIRYTPRADSYFSGDDPVAIMAAAPGLTGLRISPREPWGALATTIPMPATWSSRRSLRRADQRSRRRSASSPTRSRSSTGRSASRSRDRRRGRSRRCGSTPSGSTDWPTSPTIWSSPRTAWPTWPLQAERLAGGQALSQALRGRQAQLDRLVGDLHATVGKVRLVAAGADVRPLSAPGARDRPLAGQGPSCWRRPGGDVEVDKAIVDGLFEPLLHVLRNAIDHGVETAEPRQAGKPAGAVIRLAARTEADQVVIEVADDGAGVDPAQGSRGRGASEAC
jgi:two-component system chemotaxis sensor kinase CheA